MQGIVDGLMIKVENNRVCRWDEHLLDWIRSTKTVEYAEQVIRNGQKTKSEVPGVSYEDDQHRWLARMYIGRRTIFLGTFKARSDAEKARMDAEKLYKPFEIKTKPVINSKS